MQVVLYSQIALQRWEKQHNNAKHGVKLAFLMEFHAYQKLNAHPIKLNKHAKIREQMVLVFGLLIRLVDFNYVPMLIQIKILMMVVMLLLLQQSALLQEQPAFN